MMNFIKKTTIFAIMGLMSLSPIFANAQSSFFPNDPSISRQWYINSLQMFEAWGYSTGVNQIVAVIDSGIDVDHPDLINNIYINQGEIFGDGIDNDGNGFIDDYQGWDFLDDDNNAKPTSNGTCTEANNCDINAYYHGTVVAGIIAATTNNGFSVAGLAHGAKIMPLRVLDSLGSGNSDNVVKAINYAILNQVDIINMSFAGLTEDPGLSRAIERAYNAGIAVVIAAGNQEGRRAINLDQSPRYPVCSRGAAGQKISFGVGTHTQSYKLADFSNYGSSCIDLLAPGENIFGIVTQEPESNTQAYELGGFRGTSLAAPMASAAIAIIKTYRPSLTVGEIFQLLRANAYNISAQNQGFEDVIGAGALNIIDSIKNLPPEPVPTPTPTPNPTPSPIFGLSYGDVIKSSTSSTVYYYAPDGKRYVFLDSKTYFSWYPDFSAVKTIAPETISQVSLGGVVTMRPGVNLVKVSSTPQVYAVDKNGTLRWLSSENVARQIFGDNWASLVVDLPDSFFISYKIGADINNPSEYDRAAVLLGSPTISADKGL